MADEVPRLFIVDQTLKDYHGHHFEYDAAIAEAALAAGLTTVILANKKYELARTEATEVVPWFQTSWIDSSTDARHARTFWRAALDFFAQRRATSNDIVLVHTVSFAEFEHIIDYFDGLLWHDVAMLPTIYVILRRDPDECSERLAEALRTKLRKLREIPDLMYRLVLCVDTEQLREGWSESLGQPVLTLPIPFRHALVDRLARKRDTDAPLQVVYLGDARPEKGYQHFPGMVEALWKSFIEPGSVEVTLQSNYNMPGGEGGIPQARLRLQRYPHGVTLLTRLLEPEEYYAVLAKADIIVLPYDPESYGRRSSGVLNEAISAGKVTVVSEGTWLASQVAPDRAVVYSHPGGLADGVIAAIRSFDKLSRGAVDFRTKYRLEQNPDRFVQMLLQHRRSVKPQPSGSVLYVMDGDSIVNRTGAGSVARQQMQALIDLGYRVHAVFLRTHVDEDHNVQAMRVWMDTIREEVRTLRLTSVWGAGHTPFYGHAGLMSEREILRNRNLRLDANANYWGSAAIPAGLIETLRTDPPSFGLVNYVQSIPFARNLVGPQTPLLCETLDIQAFQIALRSPEGLQDNDLDLELKLLRDAAHVIAINQLEADFIADRLGRDRVSYIPQPVSGGPVRLSALAAARDLAELVENCGPSHAAFDSKLAKSTPAPNSATWFRQAKSIDLLYVSSNHGPNLEGLQLFLHHVFYSRLIERGITLAVAGTICERLGHVEGPQVLLAHRVNDLVPLYAAAKVVILPILDGAGSAIKTIEALARAKPVVATSFAMRGVDRSSEPFPIYDDWFDFGDRILQLLASDAERLVAAQASFRLGRVNGNDGLYSRRLGRAVALTLNQAAEATTGVEQQIQTPIEPPGQLIEWNETIRAFNKVGSDFITQGYAAPADIEAYNKAPLDRGDAEELFTLALKKFEGSGTSRRAADGENLFERLLQVVGGSEAESETERHLDRAEVSVAAGVAARLLAYDKGGPEVIWRSADRRVDKKARAAGLVFVTLPRVTPGSIVEQIFDLAVAPSAGKAACIVADGMHRPEESTGGTLRWTGPETASTFLITISRRYDVELSLQVHGAANDGVFAHAMFEVNGQPLPTLKWNRDGKRMLVTLVPRASDPVSDRVVVVLHVPLTIAQNSLDPASSDSRPVGLLLGRLTARSQITTAPSLDRSFVSEAFAMMTERSPADLVYAGYRDLHAREPDAVGSAHYISELSEHKITAYQFLRVGINSEEFARKFPVPRLVALLDRCMPME